MSAQIQHPTQEFICQECQKTYKYKSGLDKHNATKHQVTNLNHPSTATASPSTTITNPTTTTQSATAIIGQQQPQQQLSPFLKWVGGKTQIIDELFTRFPRKINNYYEPFLGGGSVLLALLQAKAAGKIRVDGNIYASDLNPALLACYKNIKHEPDRVILEASQLITAYKACPVMNATPKNTSPQTLAEAGQAQENYYYWVRKLYNALTLAEKQTPRGSAMFIFLNKTCFRGLYREGPHGFNVPFGNYSNPQILDPTQIRQISAAIQHVEFTVCGFEIVLGRANFAADDFVYVDPPYAPKNATSFVGYTADGFSLQQHGELFKLCRELSNPSNARTNGAVKMMMSNAEVPLVKDTFPAAGGFTTTIILCKRHINSKNPGETTNEVIIQNY
jgi:DNA adenine methylase